MSTLLTLCSCSLRVASKLPKGNLLLLKSLLSLLQNISRNAATSRMTAGNLAVCVGPNLLSPAEEHTLPLDVLLQVTGKVRCVYQPATGFWAHFWAVQRYLAASSLQQTLVGELPGRAAPQLQLSAQKPGSGVAKAV